MSILIKSVFFSVKYISAYKVIREIYDTVCNRLSGIWWIFILGINAALMMRLCVMCEVREIVDIRDILRKFSVS